MIFKRFSFRKKKPELSELRNVCEQDNNFLKGISSVKTKVFETQKQPSRGVPRRSVLKICSKFTGEHPCFL